MHGLHIEGAFGGSQADAKTIVKPNGPFTEQDYSDYCDMATAIFLAAQVKLSKLREVVEVLKNDWVMLKQDPRVEDTCRGLPKILRSSEQVRLIILYTCNQTFLLNMNNKVYTRASPLFCFMLQGSQTSHSDSWGHPDMQVMNVHVTDGSSTAIGESLNVLAKVKKLTNDATKTQKQQILAMKKELKPKFDNGVDKFGLNSVVASGTYTIMPTDVYVPTLYYRLIFFFFYLFFSLCAYVCLVSLRILTTLPP